MTSNLLIKLLEFEVPTFHKFFVWEEVSPSITTTLTKNHKRSHAARIVSKSSIANCGAIQLLADKRCRWLICQCHNLRLTRWQRRKKKARSRTNAKENAIAISSNPFLYYSLKKSEPVAFTIGNTIPIFGRCNDCKVIKLFKKRRKRINNKTPQKDSD